MTPDQKLHAALGALIAGVCTFMAGLVAVMRALAQQEPAHA